jgi:hypothetical protein
MLPFENIGQLVPAKMTKAAAHSVMEPMNSVDSRESILLVSAFRDLSSLYLYRIAPMEIKVKSDMNTIKAT